MPQPTDSPLRLFASLTAEEQQKLLEETAAAQGVTVEQLKAELAYRWEGWRARPAQCEPEGAWTFWIILAGRGWGKTLTGAEWARKKALEHPGCRVALVAPTFADGRDTMVEGETGLLAVLRSSELRDGSRDKAWNRSMGELFLANGSRFRVFSSEKPNRLRGPQHHFAWCDEVSSWEDAKQGDALETTWSNMLLGLRLGDAPRCLVTTTPKPNKLTKDVLALEAEKVVVLRPTWDNLDNLAGTFYEQIIHQYKGTRAGLQELEAKLLEDVEGALWSAKRLDECRVNTHPPLDVIVVGVDPNISNDEAANEAGVVVAGKSRHHQKAFVLADKTTAGGPLAWARAAVAAYHNFEADVIVAEKNQGGEMVRITLHTVDRNVPVKLVHASRGKRTRAEPVAALYGASPGDEVAGGEAKASDVFHVGAFPELEAEMTTWVPDDESPDRMDALVWALTDLMLDKRGGRQYAKESFGEEPVVRRGDLTLIGERYVDKE